MGLCEKTKSTFDWCTWKWQGEWNQVGKHTSGCYPGELPQPSKTGQHSNSGKTDNTTKTLLKKKKKKWTKPARSMGLCKKTKSTSDWGAWKWGGKWNQVRKHSSGYHPGELPQPSRAGQHSNPGNTENTTKIFLVKSNSKTHNHQIHQGWNEGKNIKGSQRERSGYPQRGSLSD